MPYYKITDYKLLRYEKSNYKNKKYNAILENKKTKKIVKVPFGDSRYEEHYQDKTGLNLYKKHNDDKRRKLYRLRHQKYIKSGYFSPGWFSYYILW